MNTKRFTSIFASLLTSFTSVAILVVLLALQSNLARAEILAPVATVRYVSPTGNDTINDCVTSTTPCRTVQHAMALAQAGDEIRVATGTYTGTVHDPDLWAGGVTATVIISKDIASLTGGYSPDFIIRDPDLYPTTLSASDTPRGFVVAISGTNTLLDGFILTGATGACPGDCSDIVYTGGAIRARDASPTIRHNRIQGNFGYAGGGIGYTGSGSPTIIDNLIYSNTTSSSGGGIYIQATTAVISGNQIISNVAETEGGGIFILNTTASIASNTIAYNRVISATAGRGGGMFSDNSGPTLTNVIFDGNTAHDGGGIYNYESSPILTDVIFDGNTATNSGGGILNYSGSPVITGGSFTGNSAGWGGGAFNEASSPTFTDVTFDSNTASDSGGGMDNLNSNPTVTGGSFIGNSAGWGGGVLNEASSPTFTDVTFDNNTASNNGGGMDNLDSNPTVTGGAFTGNSADAGGGLFNDVGSITTLTGVAVNNNSATNGGGIYNYSGDVTVTDSTLSGNTTTSSGGGIYNRDILTVVNSTLSGNSAANLIIGGGGINNYLGTLTVMNSTLVGNQTEGTGGGILSFGSISVHSNLTLKNSTLSGNSANNGGGGINNNNNSSLNFYNTIVANSTVGGDCWNSGTIAANVSNLVENGSCSAGGVNFQSGDPHLAALMDNGGHTWTMALENDSPAIDTGNDATCVSPDQRGVTRPQGDHCDIGAYEYRLDPPSVLSIYLPLVIRNGP